MMSKNNNDPAVLPVAVHVFFIKDGKVLLLKRINTGFKDGQWSLPAGRLNNGESIFSAACREAEEEVGVKINEKDFTDSLVMHHNDERGNRLYFFFKFNKWVGNFKNKEIDKCEKIEWFNIDKLPDSTVDHIKHALNSIESGISYTQYGF